LTVTTQDSEFVLNSGLDLTKERETSLRDGVLALENFKLLPAVIVLHNCGLVITAIFCAKVGKMGFGVRICRVRISLIRVSCQYSYQQLSASRLIVTNRLMH